MSWQKRLPTPAPFLTAWYLALTLLGEGGFSRAREMDIAGSLLLATLTALVAWLVTRRLEPVRGAVVSVILVVWFGLYGTARLLLTQELPDPLATRWGVLVLWTGVATLGVLAIQRWNAVSSGLTRGLNTALVILVIFSLYPVIPKHTAKAPAITQTVVDNRSPDRPDIYIVVLDMFSNPADLKAHYKLDLGWFVDSLKSLGFAVPSRARTNYIHTGLVLPTLLNWRLVHEGLGGPDDTPWEETPHLVEDASAWALLASHGYRLAFFPTGYKATSANEHADIVLRSPEPFLEGFGQTWIFNTPLDLWPAQSCSGGPCTGNPNFPIPVEGPDALRWKLRQLAALTDSAGPIVTFLHFLGSHEPFVFNRDCSPREAWWPRAENGPDSLAIRKAYADQIECVAHLVISSVTNILAKSKTPPVIILQADHGNGSIRIGTMQAQTVDVEAATPAQLRERLRVFAAYKFPGAANVVYDTITPVNVLPVVFNSVLGTSLPRSADRSWWSTWQRPLGLRAMRWIGDSVAPDSPGTPNGAAHAVSHASAAPRSDND